MEPKESSSSPDTPNLIYLSVFDLADKESFDKSIGLMKKTYAPNMVEQDDKIIRIGLQNSRCFIKLSQTKNCLVFSLTLNLTQRDHVSNRWQDELQHYRSQVNTATDMLPKNPVLAMFLFVNPVHSQEEVPKLVQQYSQHIGCHKIAAGIVNNHLIATFRMTDGEKGSSAVRREIIVSPINEGFPEGKDNLLPLVEDIKDLHMNLAELSRLYKSCQPYFPQLDPAEKEVLEKTEAIRIRIRQTEPVELETLKSWLADVMDRSSAISIMSSLIARDQITATGCVNENESILNRWSERNLEGYPMNTLMEITEYKSMMGPFSGFINRTQALRARIESVSNTIRTFLDIQQQEQNAEFLKHQVKMLNSIERHESFLKRLTWAVVLLTIVLIILEVGSALHVLP